MKDVGTAFRLFQKKPEYGPSRMEVKNFKGAGVKKIHSVQSGSELYLDGKKLTGE